MCQLRLLRQKLEMNSKQPTTSMKDFEVLGPLGEGSFGQVFKVRRREDSEIYAMKKIKTIYMKEKDRVNALNEIRILASYSGDHIIGFKESFYDDSTGHLCLVLEFAQQGDLLRAITEHRKKQTRFDEQEIWKAMTHISFGLRSLHERKILHRDLKSANVFVMADGTYKLGDLNVSKVLKQGLARTQTGTPYYASPEVWKDRPYGTKSDMWSLGCVLYQMAALDPPFKAQNIEGLYKKVCAGVYPKIPSCYSSKLSEMIYSLLRQNPSSRPSPDSLLQQTQGKIVTQNRSEVSITTPQKNSPRQQTNNLLQTIKCGRNWKNINKSLPKARYSVSRSETNICQSRVEATEKEEERLVFEQMSQKVQERIEQKKVNNYVSESQEKTPEAKLSSDIDKNNLDIKKEKKTPGQRIKDRNDRIRQRILSAGRLRRNGSLVIRNYILAQSPSSKGKPSQNNKLPPRPPSRVNHYNIPLPPKIQPTHNSKQIPSKENIGRPDSTPSKRKNGEKSERSAGRSPYLRNNLLK